MSGDPLSAGSFRSMNELKSRLIEMGPAPETYDRLLNLVSDKDKDSAKDALAKFFQGSATALCFLYGCLVRSGKANAVDEEIVAEIAQMHPQENEKVAGLWIPDPSSGLGTKVASGGLGGPNSGFSYMMSGPDDKRMCPKIQNAINTFVCRYHCLDGLTIDDNQVLCGEAIWRQAIMDKFSRDFKDADGKWTGGYLRNRFVIEQDTAGNDYQLKPNERTRPIKESAWSTEKRLQEMRKDLGEKRGYQGVYEPKDVYNFDQHDLTKGPDNVQLDAKERDKIAKNSSKAFNLKKTANDGYISSPKPLSDPNLAQQDPREFMPEPVDPEALLEIARTKGVSEDQKTALIESGRARPDSFIPKDNLFLMTSRKFNLSKIAKDVTPSVSKCNNPSCPSHGAHMGYQASGVCPKCGKKTLESFSSEQVTQASGGIEKAKSPAQMLGQVAFLNGTYQATKNGVKAFGATKEEALKKLALMGVGDPLQDVGADPTQPLPEDVGEQRPYINPEDGSEPEGEGDKESSLLEQLEPGSAEQESAELREMATDPSLIEQDISRTQQTLPPEEIAALEDLTRATGAGPDPKSDLQ